MRPRDLLDELRELEVALHKAHVRADPVQLAALLHEEFWEIGRSGTVWSRDATLKEFDGHPQTHVVWAQDFAVESLAPGLALLTYRSAHVANTGVLERHTYRASIWSLSQGKWKMRFHQGTPTEEFERHAI